jgi:hypothetical protein
MHFAATKLHLVSQTNLKSSSISFLTNLKTQSYMVIDLNVLAIFCVKMFRRQLPFLSCYRSSCLVFFYSNLFTIFSSLPPVYLFVSLFFYMPILKGFIRLCLFFPILFFVVFVRLFRLSVYSLFLLLKTKQLLFSNDCSCKDFSYFSKFDPKCFKIKRKPASVKSLIVGLQFV